MPGTVEGMTSIQEPTRTPSVHTCHWWQRHNARWLTVLLAMSLASLLYAITGPIMGIDLQVRAGTGVQTVEGLTVVVFSVATGLAGWALLTLLRKVTRKAETVWRVIASLVLVVSLLGPLGATSVATGVVLVTMHLVVGGVLLVGLPYRPHCSCPC